MPNLEPFLKPVSENNPGGDDIEADGGLFELEQLLKVEQATDFAPAQEPDWAKVREKAMELMARSRHLKPILALCLTGLKFEGLAGFRDGLVLLRGVLEGFWDSLYPRVDPEDNDATQRINLIRNLAAPIGTNGPYRFLKWLRQVPLADGRGNRFGLEDVLASAKPPSPEVESERKIPTPAQIAAAFRDTKPEALEKTSALLIEVGELVLAVEAAMNDKVGDTAGAGLEELRNTVTAVQECLSSNTPGGSKPLAADAGGAVGDGSGESASTAQSAGLAGISSRRDVEAALDRICEYYVRFEPGSPVPLLLRRARKLIHFDFTQIMNELSLATAEALKPIFGEMEGAASGEGQASADESTQSSENSEGS